MRKQRIMPIKDPAQYLSIKMPVMLVCSCVFVGDYSVDEMCEIFCIIIKKNMFIKAVFGKNING